MLEAKAFLRGTSTGIAGGFPNQIKAPCPKWTEGVKHAVPPLVQYDLTIIPSQRQTTLFAVSGEGRLFLLVSVQKSHSGRYLGGFPHCLAPSGSSLAGKWTLTYSHQCVKNMVANFVDFVKHFMP